MLKFRGIWSVASKMEKQNKVSAYCSGPIYAIFHPWFKIRGLLGSKFFDYL
jgi:hypothetical protein